MTPVLGQRFPTCSGYGDAGGSAAPGWIRRQGWISELSGYTVLLHRAEGWPGTGRHILFHQCTPGVRC